jgi:hypothetical protein
MTGKTRFVPGHGAGADTPSWQGEPAPARAPNIAAATALFVTLLAGTTIHESRLFLVPLAYAVWAQRPIDARALRDLVLVAGLPVVVYLFLRSSIVALGQIYQPGYTGPLLSQRWTMIRNALHHGGWDGELRRLAIDYGPLFFADPVFYVSAAFVLKDRRRVAVAAVVALLALDVG